jgi:mannan endo-1,4-beta-mannosidase
MARSTAGLTVRSAARSTARLLALSALGGCVGPSSSPPPPATPGAGPPRAGVDLIAAPWSGVLTAKGEVRKAQVTPLAVTDQSFSDAVRIAINEGSGSPWGVQLQGPIAAPVDKGDALLATFYLRTEAPQEGGVGETEFVFELARAPYSKAVSYPVQAGPTWTEVQVRFLADRAYAAGEAQMIFRLGYEPETIDIGGVKVQSFGKTALGDLPATLASDRQRERAAAAALKAAEAAQATPVDGGELGFSVDPTRVIRTISPYVYGINAQRPEDTGVTLRRMGGNRQTAYNWEINASNAGNDYRHVSDAWPCTVLGYADCRTRPGAQLLDFAAANHAGGVASLVTIPLVDYVAADTGGSVNEADRAPSKRWNRSYAKKPAAFVVAPDLDDGAVYEDELVNLLVGQLGHADQGGIAFYALDNEPALWPETHPRVHPDKTTYAEMVSRTEAMATEIVRLDPGAVVLGGVTFGWSEMMSLASAPDAQENNARYGSYVDYFLAQMKTLEQKHHRRLVHVLDVHWYPEARGAKRITEKDVSLRTIAARLQAPRSLWDPTYTEKSWIAAEWGKPIRLVPWLQERIAARYPGTKLGITEYNFGAGDHISGGLAQADALGALGREGVYLANYWGDGPGNGALPRFIKGAFKLYRNYDGKKGTFGDTAVAAKGDLERSSIYAATDSKHPGVLTVLIINKDVRATFDGRIQLGDAAYRTAAVYRLDAGSPDVGTQPAVDVRNGTLAARLPALSATLFVCRR